MSVLGRQLGVLSGELSIGLAEVRKLSENVLRRLRLIRLELFGGRLALAGLETSVFTFEVLAMSVREEISSGPRR